MTSTAMSRSVSDTCSNGESPIRLSGLVRFGLYSRRRCQTLFTVNIYILHEIGRPIKLCVMLSPAVILRIWRLGFLRLCFATPGKSFTLLVMALFWLLDVRWLKEFSPMFFLSLISRWMSGSAVIILTLARHRWYPSPSIVLNGSHVNVPWINGTCGTFRGYSPIQWNDLLVHNIGNQFSGCSMPDFRANITTFYFCPSLLSLYCTQYTGYAELHFLQSFLENELKKNAVTFEEWT